MCGDCVVTWISTRSPTRRGASRLGLDVGVLDEPRLELALDLDLGPCERAVEIAAADVAADQDVPVSRIVQPGRIVGQRLVDRQQGRQLLPGHREPREIQGLDAVGLADDHRDRLAPEPHLGLREHGLIGRGGDHPESVAAVDVGRGEHRDRPPASRTHTRPGRRAGTARGGAATARPGSAAHRRRPDPRRRRRCPRPSERRRRAAPDDRPPCRPVATPPRRRPFAHPSRPRRSSGSRCSGTGPRRGHPSPAARWAPRSRGGAPPPRRASRACRSRTARPRARGRRSAVRSPRRSRAAPRASRRGVRPGDRPGSCTR